MNRWPVLRLPNGDLAPTGWALVDAVRATLRLLNKHPDPVLDPERKELLMALLKVADHDEIAGPHLAAEVQSILDYESARNRNARPRLDNGR